MIGERPVLNLRAEDAQKYKAKIDLLIVTATDIETEALKRQLKPLSSEKAIAVTHINTQTYLLGTFGSFAAVQMQCEMGSRNADSAKDATLEAVRYWNPRAVIMPGTAWGNPHKGFKLKDVLISESVIDYENAKVSDTYDIRGLAERAGDVLINRFKNVASWHNGLTNVEDTDKSTLQRGLLLCGDKVIAKADFRDMLLKKFPRAIGGDMESWGVSQACRKEHLEWIVVKGICDWGDEHKNDTWQQAAASRSVALCAAVLSNPSALDGIPVRKKYLLEQETLYPDAGLEKSSPPASKLAYIIDPVDFPSFPVDVGTIWGLNRSHFIGIVASLVDEEIYEGIVRAERALYDAIQESKALGDVIPPLITRWWIRINPLKLPNGPQNEKDVWSCAVFQNDPLVDSLQTKGLEKSTIPGIFIEINTENDSDGLVPSVQLWCESLINKVFTDRQVAVILHIVGNNIDEAKIKARSIKDGLVKLYPGFSEIISILFRPPGALDKKAQYKENIDTSTSEARRKSLILASRSDIQMDAWVNGTNLEPDKMPRDEELRADTNTGALINKFVLAMLRKYHHDKPDIIKRIIEERKHLMGQALKAVCEFCFSQQDETEFLRRHGAREFQLLVQTGVEIKMPVNLIRDIKPEKPDLWWLLEATPPDKRSITELLSMDVRQRAILRLCSREELKLLETDSNAMDWIKGCRRN